MRNRFIFVDGDPGKRWYEAVVVLVGRQKPFSTEELT